MSVDYKKVEVNEVHQSREGNSLAYAEQVSTLHVGPDSRSQLRAAANREAELLAQVDVLRSRVQVLSHSPLHPHDPHRTSLVVSCDLTISL